MTDKIYTDYNDDNAGGALNNWSNGLNFYRTSEVGSWGFTTIDQTVLYTADVLLLNGATANYLNTQGGEDTAGNLAQGLSFHVGGSGDFTNGWCYNATGNDLTCMNNQDQRVFWTTDVSVPAPAGFVLFALGLIGIGFRRKYT